MPVKDIVAGISVGLLVQHWPRAKIDADCCGTASNSTELYGRHVLLLDIQGMEDALGDMDFKVPTNMSAGMDLHGGEDGVEAGK